jgi:hypothetical protein
VLGVSLEVCDAQKMAYRMIVYILDFFVSTAKSVATVPCLDYEVITLYKNDRSIRYLISLSFVSLSLDAMQSQLTIHLRYRDRDNLDILLRLLLIHLGILNLMHNVQALNRSSEDSMLIIKPRLRMQLANNY